MTHSGVRTPHVLPFLARWLLQAMVLALPAGLVLANNVGENAAWQFSTSADKVNAAAVQDMVQKKQSGYYSPPVTTYNYSTHIDRQYNCDVSSAATGNQGSNSTVANSPSSAGASSQSTGNASDASAGTATGNSDVRNAQSNSGVVAAGAVGNTHSHVNGTAWQALNSNQSNTGNQSAVVNGSTACAFGALN